MVIYFVDIVVFNIIPDFVLVKTVIVIQCLKEAGFMLNMKELDFLEKEIKMLNF